MSVTITTLAEPLSVLKLRATDKLPPSYLKELSENGFCVVKNVIDEQKAGAYRSKAYDWLESHGLGFDREDRSTWNVANLPPHAKGGMYRVGAIGHEQFAWDIRSEPAVIEVFANILGTEKLVVSFDAVNMALPLPEEEIAAKLPPWPHVDQSPLKRGLHCVQGIVNLGENGPEDGGLMVLEGAMALYDQFFDEQPTSSLEKLSNPDPERDLYLHSNEELQWFLDRGCKWVKPTCGPGDMILWDSRCVHYGSMPKSDRPRCATYVCMKPVSMISPDHLRMKQEALKSLTMTTHEPTKTYLSVLPEEWNIYRSKPLQPPVLSDRALRLAGMLEYE